MGMSASQARLMSLTARLSDLEYKAQVISNAKIRLADQSEEASTAYLNALDNEKLTVSNGVNRVDATAQNLTTYGAISTSDRQRFIKNNSGQVLVSEAVANAYNNSQTATFVPTIPPPRTIDSGREINEGGIGDLDGARRIRPLNSASNIQQSYGTVEKFLKAMLGYSTQAEAEAAGKTYDQKQVAYYTNCFTGFEAFLQSQGYTSNPNADQNTQSGLVNDPAATAYYTNLYNEIAENGCVGVPIGEMTSTDWLENQIASGNVHLYEYSSTGGSQGTGDFVNVSWTSGDPSLAMEKDNSDLARAEAKYNLALQQIASKDKRFDLELTSINTEHQAIQTEMDSVKKVITKNIERSFKTFDA